VLTLPHVISPIETLFGRGGIDTALISVEFWPTRLVVRLAALENRLTEAQDRAYGVALEQWGRVRVASGTVAAGDPPVQPGTRLLAPLGVAVEDDVGTVYTIRGSATAGTGSEWRGDWFFAADVPPSISRLRVRVDSPDNEHATVELDLAE
jgi:hypothetical protein